MENLNADTIMDNLNFLSQKTRSLYKIMTILIEKNVLTNRDRRSIMLLPDSYTKAYDLYTQMADKGETACQVLMEAWTSTGNDELTSKVINDNTYRTLTSLNEENESVYQIAGGRNEYIPLKELPESILAISEKLTELDFSWVEIDAYSFPQVVEKFSNVRKLKLSNAKINGIFTSKIRLENLKEFYLTVVGGKVNYQNKTDSIKFLIFVDTLSMPDPNKNYWEINRIWKQRCDFTVGFDGKVLLNSRPTKNTFSSSLSDSHLFLDQIDSNLEKLALSRVKLDNHYIHIHNRLTELILHQVEGSSNNTISALIQNCKRLKTLKLVAKNQVDINTCHLPPLLTNLFLGNVNISYNTGDSFCLETLALDFCILPCDLKDDFHKVFQCSNIFVGGEGYLFEPDDRLFRNVLQIGSKLQRVCMSGFNYAEEEEDMDESASHEFSTRQFLDLLGIPQGTHTFTMEILNGSWRGLICSPEILHLYKYEWFGWDCFWEKENYSCLNY